MNEVYQKALALEISSYDCEARTVREYLQELLRKLWREEDRFSGKRPFGNSGWKYDLYDPLVRAGFIRGTFEEDEVDEDGEVYRDSATPNSMVGANNFIDALILEAFSMEPQP